MTLEERLFSKIDSVDDCWVWKGAKNIDGYGVVNILGKQRRAHRLIYELLIEPIDRHLVIDHLCRNRSCVNPNHMEPVTDLENRLRGWEDYPDRPTNNNHSYCRKGLHKFTGNNIYRYYRNDGKNPRVERRCKKCFLTYAKQRRNSFEKYLTSIL